MLDIAEHVLRLLAFHPVTHQRAGKNRVFAHIFKRSSVARLSRDIYAAAERNVVALSAQLTSNQLAVFASRMNIPAGRRTDIRRQRRRIPPIVTAVPHSIRGIAHLNDRNAQPRNAQHKTGPAIAQISVRPWLAPPWHAIAMDQIDLLIER